MTYSIFIIYYFDLLFDKTSHSIASQKRFWVGLVCYATDCLGFSLLANVTEVFIAPHMLNYLEYILWKYNIQGKVENLETGYFFVVVQILVLSFSGKPEMSDDCSLYVTLTNIIIFIFYVTNKGRIVSIYY